MTFAAGGLLTFAYCCWLARPRHPSLELSAADDRTITELDASWAVAWTSKNVSAIVAYYADNASVRIPGWWSRGLGRPGPDASQWFPTSGKRYIREELANPLRDSGLTIAISSVDFVGSLALGEYSLRRANPKTGLPLLVFRGSYDASYDKGPDGIWRISRQTFEGGNSGPSDPMSLDPNLSWRRLKTNDIATFLAPHRSRS